VWRTISSIPVSRRATESGADLMNCGRFPTTERTRTRVIVSGDEHAVVRAVAAGTALAIVLGAAGREAHPSVWPSPRPRSARLQPALQRLIAAGRPVYCGGAHGNEVALTFDDGPGPYTPIALRILRRVHDHATFFVMGKRLVRRPSLVREELRVGDVGDHTWTHRDLTLLPPADARREIARTARALRKLTGHRVVFFRPPYGARNRRVDAIARRLGLLEVIWSVDTRDSEGAVPAQIAAAIEHAPPGAIILMHENRGQTLKGLHWEHALRALRARHLRAVSLTQLLVTDPPSRAQLAKGSRGCETARVSGRG
jgi:peptidoglycan-N-acetylglucosamine deacetylase